MKKIIIPLFLCLLFMLSSCNSKHQPTYEELEEKIFELEELIGEQNARLDEIDVDLISEYEILLDDIGSYEDDLATVWCYFEEEEDVTRQEAAEAFSRIDDFLTNLIYPGSGRR